MAIEVVWPRHKWDYLTVSDPDMPVDPPPLPSTAVNLSSHRSTVTSPDAVTLSDASDGLSSAFDIDDSNVEMVAPATQTRRRVRRADRGDRSPASVDPMHQHGRALAVHAFLQGAQCRVGRVSALLGVSARSVRRDRARPPVTTSPTREVAQTLVAASADRGSTSAEREAALAWMTGEAAPASVEPSIEVSLPPLRPCDDGHLRDRVHDENSVPKHQAAPTTAPLTRDQVDACSRLHRRIRLRSVLLDCAFTAETLDPPTLRAIAEDLIADIIAAARSIGAIVQR